MKYEVLIISEIRVICDSDRFGITKLTPAECQMKQARVVYPMIHTVDLWVSLANPNLQN